MGGYYLSPSLYFGPSVELFNTGSSTNDGFIGKYTDGGASATLVWAKNVGGDSGSEQVAGLAASGSNVYAVGYFGSTTATFDSFSRSTTAGAVFVAKLADAGTTAAYTWVEQGLGTGGSQANAVALAGTTLYLGGYAVPPVTFGGQGLAAMATAQVSFVASLSDTPPAAPVLSSFDLASGPVGTSVVITGTGFNNASAVKFNGTAATGYTVNTAGTQLTVAVPTGATTGTISLTTPGSTTTSSTSFTVVLPPTITSFSPPDGPVATSVIITGTNLSNATAVTFNNVNAPGFVVNSATQITVSVPAGASTGPVSVTTPIGTGSSSGNFVFLPTPTLSGFAPALGPEGRPVVLSGTNLDVVTAVRFNGVNAPGFVINSPTQITVSVPAGATSGPVSATAPGGTATSTASFAVTPAVTAFTPGSGAPGDGVVITGTTFTGATGVAFNGTPAASFVVNSATQITTTVPIGASTGVITVTTPAGSGTSVSSFTVNGGIPPVVTSVAVISYPAMPTYYNIGQTVDIQVSFDRAVQVDGALPTLLIALSAGSSTALYQYGSGTSTLTFRYTVTSGDFDMDGITLGAAIQLPGGATIRNDADGASINPALNKVAPTANVIVDGQRPVVLSSVRLLPATTTATGPDVTFRVTFNEPVYGSLAPVSAASFVPVSTGGVGGTVSTVVSVAGQNNRVFDVTVTGINGDGSVTLTVPTSGTPVITDGALNHMLVAFSTGETYTIIPGNLTVNTPQNVTGMYANVTVGPGGAATITGNLTVTTQVAVQAGGAFWFGPPSGSFHRGTGAAACAVASGAGSFVLEPGATLGICDPSGISQSGATGAVQVTGARTFSGQAHYIYDGTGAQITGTGLPATVAGLTVGNPDGVTLTDATTVSGFLRLTNGDLTVPAAKTLAIANGATLTAGSHLIGGAGSFELLSGAVFKTAHPAGISALGTATGTVQTATARSFGPDASYVYNGTAAQVTGTGLPGTVASLTLDNPAGATLTNGLFISNSLTTTSGVLATNTRSVTLAPTATLAEQETSYVLGKVAASRALNPGTAEAFGGLGLTLTPALGSAAPDTTLVTRTTGTALTGAGTSQSILRSFNVTPTVNTGLNAALDFAYFDHELNGIPAAKLALFKSESGSAPWVPQRGTTTAGNVISKTGVTDFSVWTLGNAANPLPVELRAFTATAEGGQAVRLAWATASEKNSASFEVERSADGRTFARVGMVAAAGTSSAPRSYALLDASLPARQPTLYYRLRQVDADGTFSYSPVRAVALKDAISLALYPNPTTTSATLFGAQPGAAATVFDALGRPVASALADATGTAVLALPQGLPRGMYVVRSGPHALRLTVE